MHAFHIKLYDNRVYVYPHKNREQNFISELANKAFILYAVGLFDMSQIFNPRKSELHNDKCGDDTTI